MQLEVGKHYKTRDGRKVGPVVETGNDYWPFKFRRYFYENDGFSCLGARHQRDEADDLISEWVDDVRHDKDPAPYEIAAQYKIIVTVTNGDITVTYDGRDQ